MKRCIAIGTVGLIIAVTASSAHAVPIVDGGVNGYDEGYTAGYELLYNVQNGPQNQSGAMLFLGEDGDRIFVGVTFPTVLNDNTYDADMTNSDATDGDDFRAEDWDQKFHGLFEGGGGKSLSGSDKWKFNGALAVDGGADISKLEFDYIEGDDMATQRSRATGPTQNSIPIRKRSITFGS